MNGTGRGGKAQEEDQIGIEEYSASGAPAGGKSHESHAGAYGDTSDACSAHSRRRTGRGEVGFRDFFRGGQSHSQAHADREYSEPVQVAFDAGVECAEEQEEGVTAKCYLAGLGAPRFGAPFFCVFAKHIRKRKSRSLGLRVASSASRRKKQKRATLRSG